MSLVVAGMLNQHGDVPGHRVWNVGSRLTGKALSSDEGGTCHNQQSTDQLWLPVLSLPLAPGADGERAVAEARALLDTASSASSSSPSPSSPAPAAPATNGKKGGKGGAAGAAAAAAAPGPALLSEALGALADDLNTPAAVGALSAPLRTINDLLTTKAGKKRPDR